MNLRPDGLLLPLVLTALFANPAHAWAADLGASSPAKGEVKIHESIGPFHPDDAASAGLSSREPGTQTLDLVHEPAPHQGAFFPMPPLVATQRPRPVDGSIDYDLLKTDEEDALDGGRVSPSGLRFNGVNVGAAAWAMFGRLTPHRQKSETNEADAIDGGTDEYAKSEHYHWRGLLAQSLFFNVIENGFRAASDDQIRNLLGKQTVLA